MPSSLASSGMAPALWTATARLVSSLGMPRGFTLRRIDVSAVELDDLIPYLRVLRGAQRFRDEGHDAAGGVGADARRDIGWARDQGQGFLHVLGVDGAFEFLVPLRSNVLDALGK